jgi:hypothetical protein
MIVVNGVYGFVFQTISVHSNSAVVSDLQEVVPEGEFGEEFEGFG